MTVVEIVNSGGLITIAGILVGCVWRASAKITKFESACERLANTEKIQQNHTTAIALQNTSIAVINTKLDIIIQNQQDTKQEFAEFKKEWLLNK